MVTSDRFAASVTGDLLLVASVLTLVPSWIGGVELLSALGMGNVPAAVVGGAYAWGRGGLSAVVLARRWRRGTLSLTRSRLSSSLRAIAGRSALADYPAPYRPSLSAGVGAAPA